MSLCKWQSCLHAEIALLLELAPLWAGKMTAIIFDGSICFMMSFDALWICIFGCVLYDVNLRATPRLSRSRFRKPSMSSCTSFRAEREGLFFVHVYAPGIPKSCMSVYHCISAIPATTIYNALHLPELSLNRIPGRIGNPFFCVAARPHLPRFGYTKGPCHRICVNFHFRGRCGTWPKTNGNGISKILPHIYPIYPLPL